MKTRTALALTGLAISFPLPTFAQEQNAVDPEARHQIEDAGSRKAALMDLGASREILD